MNLTLVFVTFKRKIPWLTMRDSLPYGALVYFWRTPAAVVHKRIEGCCRCVIGKGITATTPVEKCKSGRNQCIKGALTSKSAPLIISFILTGKWRLQSTNSLPISRKRSLRDLTKEMFVCSCIASFLYGVNKVARLLILPPTTLPIPLVVSRRSIRLSPVRLFNFMSRS